MKRTRNLWNSLEALPSLAAVLAEWKDETGPDFDRAKAFLRPTDEQATSYPCTNMPPCDCRHEVVIHAPQRIVAACRCEAGDCRAIQLKRADLMVYRLDVAKLGEAVRAAFGFDPVDCSVNYVARRSIRIGTIGPRRSDVYLVLGCDDEDALLREVEGLLAGGAEPFIMMTATRRFFTPRTDGALKRQSCVLVPLSVTSTLVDGSFVVVGTRVEGLLDAFLRGAGGGRDLARAVDGIARDVQRLALQDGSFRKKLGTSGTVKEIDFTASAHFANLAWRGNTYVIRRNAALIVETLYVALKSFGIPGLHVDELFAQVYGFDKKKWPIRNPRVQNFFRKNDAKRLWEDGLIKHDGKGNFRINIEIHT